MMLAYWHWILTGTVVWALLDRLAVCLTILHEEYQWPLFPRP